ncbi:LysR family transcriptional regulator [Jannaschia pagri]|uniref:LysR family transcriptional regulator n=1 Tax=Jannaschia pagri TaxID=2829797 RepID=A0ABQ4NLF8_9RHOB|nr:MULTISPECIES: LysR family transcriptional regulator [unclassified Jannaschia]GIT91238.1 LysR family transcriptional regulator [Jannaschia sp. AI_61]GIT95070.1 LysR family transcriptional regulator [Jannaschia sp. AI_62]
MNTWSDIAVFLAVMRQGSAAAAARTLGTNQTTVSRRIERLERSLGLKLFDAGPRGAQPTPPAHRLLPDAEAVEAAAQALRNTADGLTRRLSGKIHVTAHPTAVRYAAGLLHRFERLHPEAHVTVDAETRTMSLEDGEADVAVRPGARLVGDTLVARKLFDHPWGFYGSEAYLARHGTPSSFAEMAQHRLVALSGDLGLVEPMAMARDRLPPVREVSETETLYGVIGLVRAGEGLGFLPRAEGDTEVGLTYCFSEPDLIQTHWLVTTQTGHADPLIRAFFRFCAEEVPRLLAELPREWRA